MLQNRKIFIKNIKRYNLGNLTSLGLKDFFLSIPGPSKELTARDLIMFCFHIAKGMEYLSSKKVNIEYWIRGRLQ